MFKSGTLLKHNHMTSSVLTNWYPKLFGGYGQYFWLRKFLKMMMNVKENDVGFHSARKGAFSHVWLGEMLHHQFFQYSCKQCGFDEGSIFAFWESLWSLIENRGQWNGYILQTFSNILFIFGFFKRCNAEDMEKDVDNHLLSFIVRGGIVCLQI